MKSFSEASQEATLLYLNKAALSNLSKQIQGSGQLPLEFDEDNDDEIIENCEEDDQVEVDLFKMREDANAQVLQVVQDKTLIATADDKEIVRQFVEQTKELMDREKGKSIAKKLNLGDTISSRIEASVIIQEPLIKTEYQKCIDRKTTLIYGNVKAIIPLCRERLELEEIDDTGKTRYRRGHMEPLDERMCFGVLTKSQVGYIPSIDICFKEDDSEDYIFLRDTYIFKSLISANLTKSINLQSQFNDSEATPPFIP